MSIAIVIPARLHSTRLPRKLVLRDTGKPLIQHTYEMAQKADVGPVYVATDSLEIEQAVEAFGGQVLMTPAASSGTARVAWATANRLPLTIDHIINVQADEPELDPAYLSRLATLLIDAQVATLASPIIDATEMRCENVVKVVLNRMNDAMYFSRSAIPWVNPKTAKSFCTDGYGLRHIGVYGYHRSFLTRLCFEPDAISFLTRSEDLEQINWLYFGVNVRVGVVENSHPGIDTPDDYQGFCKRFLSARSQSEAV